MDNCLVCMTQDSSLADSDYINIMYDTVLYYNTWYYNYILLFYIIYPLSWNIIFNLLIDEYIFSSISFYECVYLFSTHDTSQLPGVDVRWTVVNSTATAVSWHEIHLRPTCDISSACEIWNKDEHGERNVIGFKCWRFWCSIRSPHAEASDWVLVSDWTTHRMQT